MNRTFPHPVFEQLPATAAKVKTALHERQGEVEVAGDDEAWAELDALFEQACIYFAARRKKAFGVLRSREVARGVVARFEELSSALKNNYTHELNVAFESGCYENHLRGLCEFMNARASQQLSTDGPSRDRRRYMDGRWTQIRDSDTTSAEFSVVYEDAIVCSRFYYQRTLV